MPIPELNTALDLNRRLT